MSGPTPLSVPLSQIQNDKRNYYYNMFYVSSRGTHGGKRNIDCDDVTVLTIAIEFQIVNSISMVNLSVNIDIVQRKQSAKNNAS